jgi:hypothetical protein
MRVDCTGVLIVEQPLVKTLQRELARAMARRAILARVGMGSFLVHGLLAACAPPLGKAIKN